MSVRCFDSVPPCLSFARGNAVPPVKIVEEHASFPAFPLANITYGVAMNYLELQTQLKFKCEVE